MFRFRLYDPSDVVDVSFCDQSDVLDALLCNQLNVFNALTQVAFFFRVSASQAALATLTLWGTIIRVRV